MNDHDDPNLVTSEKSQRVVIDGYAFLINIHRLETDTTWSLEVVDHQNDSWTLAKTLAPLMLS